jgi:hypothetical protein
VKTENLNKACESFEIFASVLREAHTDAVNSGSQSAEAALFSLIEAAVKLDAKLRCSPSAARKQVCSTAQQPVPAPPPARLSGGETAVADATEVHLDQKINAVRPAA